MLFYSQGSKLPSYQSQLYLVKGLSLKRSEIYQVTLAFLIVGT